MGVSSSQKKLLIKIIIGLVIIVSGVVGFMLMQTEMSEEAIAAREEAEKAAWGYTERVAEIEELVRLPTHQAESLMLEIMEILQVTSLGYVERGEGRGALQMDVDGFPINVTTMGGEVHTITLGEAKIYELQRDVTNLSAERVYTLPEYKRQVGDVASALGVTQEVAHQNYQRLIEASIYNLRGIEKVRRQEGKYRAKNGDMELELEVNQGRIQRVSGVIEEMGVSAVVFDDRLEDTSGGTLRDVTPIGGGRSNIGGGIEYRVGQALGIDGATQINMPVALPDASDTWVILDTDGTRNIRVRGDIDTGKGMEQKTFYIRYDIESGAIMYLKIDRKEYIK